MRLKSWDTTAILNGRIVNDSMGRYVANAAIKKMIDAGQAPKNSNVVVLGITFKENCPDIRNSKVVDIIKSLNEFDIWPSVVDPWAEENDALREYDVKLTKLKDVKNVDCVIIAVAHDEFKKLKIDEIKKLYKESKDTNKVLIDVKGIFDVSTLEKSGLSWWRL